LYPVKYEIGVLLSTLFSETDETHGKPESSYTISCLRFEIATFRTGSSRVNISVAVSVTPQRHQSLSGAQHRARYKQRIAATAWQRVLRPGFVMIVIYFGN
jgi:hypothetical protein